MVNTNRLVSLVAHFQPVQVRCDYFDSSNIENAYDFSPIWSICLKTVALSSQALAFRHRRLKVDFKILDGYARRKNLRFESIQELRSELLDIRNFHDY
jgi:hypothetical protein